MATGSTRACRTRPYDRAHQVPEWESEAYVWAVKNRDGTLKLYFAVENPSGISAKALAASLDKTLSGLTPEEIEKISPAIVEQIFGRPQGDIVVPRIRPDVVRPGVCDRIDAIVSHVMNIGHEGGVISILGCV